MMADLEYKRRRWRAALASSDHCLTPEELSDYTAGPAADPAKAKWSAHLAQCPRCQTELALLKEFEQATPRPEEAAAVSWISAELKRRSAQISTAAKRPVFSSVPKRGRAHGLRQILGSRLISAAAVSFAAMLTVITVGLYLRAAKEPALLSDGASGPAVLRSEGVITLAPKGDLGQSPTELRWEPVAGAANYSVKLMEVDRNELWQASSGQTSVSLPPAVRERIIPGKSLLWQVVAFDATGKALAASQAERFRVAINAQSNQ